MTVRNIAQASWRHELDSFSRQHEGWIVTVTTRSPDGEVVIDAQDVPLQRVNPASSDSNDIAVVVGDRRSHLTHAVHDPATLNIDVTADGIERALIIDGRDGSTTTVKFRSPMRPEEVDGLPALDRR
jgi:hypothetical protein